MQNSNKILLLFPDGVGVKNYLYTDTFKNLSQKLILWHAFDNQTVATLNKELPMVDFLKLPVYKESIKEKFLRELICLTRLKHNAKIKNNPTILSNWKSTHQSLKNKIFYKYIEWASFFVKDYKTIVRLDNYYQSILKASIFYKAIHQWLKEEQPAQIFCSHQRAVIVAPIFAASNALNIKTSTVIYSWDNLPKARLALRANQYLVWSNYMKNEMADYYPEINQSQVVITGTPQFECYLNEDNIISKQDFYTKYNLDLNKKIICYSGDDVLTSPDDPKYLEDMIIQLIKHNLVDAYQVLLRRCPVDTSGRFDHLLIKYKDFLKEATPIWQYEPGQSWVTVSPLPEDVKLLVSTAYYADVVVNVGSTMAFDFNMFEKPCIYINYDQTEKKVKDWTVKTIYNFQHFKSMPTKNAVLWWNSPNQLVDLLNQTPNMENMNLWATIVLGNYHNASTHIQSIISN